MKHEAHATLLFILLISCHTNDVALSSTRRKDTLSGVMTFVYHDPGFCSSNSTLVNTNVAIWWGRSKLGTRVPNLADNLNQRIPKDANHYHNRLQTIA